ncbi:hypothetical protein ACWE42_24475 [Sutcliffiella cohnii]
MFLLPLVLSCIASKARSMIFIHSLWNGIPSFIYTNQIQSPDIMKRGNWWESYFSSDKRTRNRLINLLFPWLQLTFQRHFGLLYPIGPALSFNKWINPNSPREVTFSDVEKQVIVDYLKRVENGEVSSNMDQYAGMTSSYEGYIGENNIFGQPLGGNAPKNV